jgi:hypothetical protein
MIMRRSFTLFLSLLVAASCSKKAETDDFPDVQSFCAEWADRVCTSVVTNACVSTAEQCKPTQVKFCEGKVPDGKYSSLTAKACLDAVGTVYSSTTLTADQRDLVTSFTGACSKIISGSGGKDAVCTDDSDCNRDVDLSCVKKAGSDSGKCEKPVSVGNGESCTAADSVCGAGFYCDGSHCVSGGAAGEACSPSKPCGATARCAASGSPTGGDSSADGGTADGGGAPPASATEGTCTALSKKTEACTKDEDCITRICLVKLSTHEGRCNDQILLSANEPSCDRLQ